MIKFKSRQLSLKMTNFKIYPVAGDTERCVTKSWNWNSTYKNKTLKIGNCSFLPRIATGLFSRPIRCRDYWACKGNPESCCRRWDFPASGSRRLEHAEMHIGRVSILLLIRRPADSVRKSFSMEENILITFVCLSAFFLWLLMSCFHFQARAKRLASCESSNF